MKLLRIVAFISAAVCAVAHANDSAARVATGGITFLKSRDIRMAEEVLEISQKQIRVEYRFVNESDRDVRETIAFPMPPYGWNPGITMWQMNIRPLRPFVARIDGREVPTRLHRQAQVAGRDITHQLRTLGLDDRQIFDTFGDAQEGFDGLTQVHREKIARLLKPHPATWEVAETMLWEQVFPARQEVRVEHEYTPFAGSIYAPMFSQGSGFRNASLLPGSVGDQPRSDEACLHEGAQRAIEARVKTLAAAQPEMVTVSLADVEYVLGTGKNWRGPIGNFRLVIRKQSPDDIVSLCFPGKPIRTSPTTLEFRQKNFVPQDKLVVYFYSVHAEN